MSSDSKPSFFFIATLMNFVLATGVFTLPFSLYESGIVLGSIILTLTCGLSIIACTFIIEALATQNSFLKDEMFVLDKASAIQRSQTITQNEYAFHKISDKPSLIFQSSPLPITTEDYNTENENNNNNYDDERDNNSKKNIETKLIPVTPFNEEEDQFYIFRRIEIAKMANKVFTKPIYYFVVVSMICYLYIGLTSNAMIAGRSILSILSKSFDQQLPNSYYYLIVCSFYTCVVLLALYNINHLKKLSMFVMFCRFIMIFLIIGSCVYSISKYGIADLSKVPKFNLPNITVIIGNSLFLFMSHHSMPGMVENFKPQKNLIKLLISGYLISLILMLSYGYISILAFGSIQDCSIDQFPCAIQSNFSLNFISLSPVGYIINYYPLLNIITSALLAITLKNNVLHVLSNFSSSLNKNLNFSEQTGLKPVVFGFLFNVTLILPSLIAAMTLGDIQQLMKYFSSVFGFIIMIIVPTMLVYATRNKFLKLNLIEVNGKLNRAFLKKNWQLVAIGCFGVLLFAMIIYGFVNSNNKKCVAEIDL